MRKLFGTDGIRGVANEELTAEIAFKLGNALAQEFKDEIKEILIGKDTRASCDFLECALASGIASGGVNARLVGIITTPGLAMLTRLLNVPGVMISASHNPFQYNGLKVINRGFKISDEKEMMLENLMENPVFSSSSSVGRVKTDSSLVELYVKRVCDMYKDTDFSSVRIAVDTANGAAYRITKMIYQQLGIKHDVFFDQPNGFNINEGCGSTNPEGLKRILENGRYDFGVLFDGDSDRCLMLSNRGTLVDGDKLMALNAVEMKKGGELKGNTVVATIMSNMGMEKYLNTHGISVERTKVGDRYVLHRMLAKGYTLGGEQSGHIIFLNRTTTGDGIITSLETMKNLLRARKTLDDLQNEIPTFPQKLLNIQAKNKNEIVENERLKDVVRSYTQSNEVRIIIRPSGTEPLVRIMVEAENESLVEKILQNVGDIVRKMAKT